MQRTDYRFTLTRDTDTFETYPAGFFDGSFKYEQQEGQLFFRVKYEGSLIFKGSDYAYFKTRYDLNEYCDIYEILIEKYDQSINNYVTFWTGYFSMLDGKFDFEKCQFIVKPTVYDKYSCLLRNWENELNVIDNYYSEISVNLKSWLEIQFKWNDQTELVPLTSMTMWRDYDLSECGIETIRHYAREAIILPKTIVLTTPWVKDDPNEGNKINDYGIDQSFNIQEYNDQIETKWVRSWTYDYETPELSDFVNVLQDVQDFQTILNNCYPGNLISDYYKFSSVVINPDFLIPPPPRVWYSKKTYKYNALTDVIVKMNGFDLSSVIVKLLKITCEDFNASTLISNFFTNSLNPATGQSNELLSLYLIQNSDAKRPSASNPATKGFLNFKDLMDDLYNLFQVSWDLDNNNNLILKHQSEIQNVEGIDITKTPYILTTAHKKSVEFDKGLIYRYEKWDIQNTENIDFVGVPIEYNELCSGKEDARSKTYNVNLTTDIGYLQQRDNNASDEGFCLVATVSSIVQNRDGILSGILEANEWLSISRLQTNYWRHNRILRNGLMNNIETTFTSSQKIRKLSEQTIILCDEFDPLKLVKTDLGDAIVTEATYFPFDSKLTLNMSI